MSFKGFGGGGMNRQVQENIARDQLRAVNKAGKAKAEAKKRQRSTIEQRNELLNGFVLRQLVNNGKEEATVVDKDYTVGVLIVKLVRNGNRTTWAPDHIQKGTLPKK